MKKPALTQGLRYLMVSMFNYSWLEGVIGVHVVSPTDAEEIGLLARRCCQVGSEVRRSAAICREEP